MGKNGCFAAEPELPRITIRSNRKQSAGKYTMNSRSSGVGGAFPRRRRGAGPHRSDVVVVGAGLSGLAAALHLEAHGARVQVVEAQDRVGGRVHSMRGLGHRHEAGGAYIGAGYRRVIGAAQRLGVELVDVTPMLGFFREQELVLDGELIRQSQWPEHPRNPFPDRDRELMPWTCHRALAVRENPLSAPGEWLNPEMARHDVSVHEWLAGLGYGAAAIRLGYGLNPSFGDDARGVSALLGFFRAAFSVAQRRLASEGVLGYTARDGVQRIPEAMAGALAGEVHHGRAVTGIVWDRRGGAEVRCADGSAYAAPHVVCSLPFGVLRGIAVDPPFPERQAEAIRSIAAQPVTQVYFAHRSRFWERDGHRPSMYTDGPAGMVAAARNGEDPEEVTSFTAWAMGRNARRLDALPEAQAGRVVREAIEAVRPAAKSQLELLGVKAWGRDPFAQGGWAFFKPGEINRFAAEMGRPHGPIRLCGEHLARDARGMEGAMESGERAARDILAA